MLAYQYGCAPRDVAVDVIEHAILMEDNRKETPRTPSVVNSLNSA
jgi:hypothetical protein